MRRILKDTFSETAIMKSKNTILLHSVFHPRFFMHFIFDKLLTLFDQSRKNTYMRAEMRSSLMFSDEASFALKRDRFVLSHRSQIVFLASHFFECSRDFRAAITTTFDSPT